MVEAPPALQEGHGSRSYVIATGLSASDDADMVRPMFKASPALLLAALALAGCGNGGKPLEAAAKSAATLLQAAQKQDRVSMETVIDRPAVRADLRRQVVAAGAQAGLAVDGGPSDFALDRMMGPDAVVRTAAREAIAQPTAEQLMLRLKTLDRQHVCLPDRAQADRCLFTFAKVRHRGWRLVGMQADLAPPVIGD
jgi:hypothetical protein